MKKPEYKEVKKNWSEYKKESGVEKMLEEQHFCPVCDKPTAKYFLEVYKDGSKSVGDVDLDTLSSWFIDEDCKFEIALEVHEDIDEDVFFTPQELGIKINIDTIRKIIKKFNVDYKKLFDTMIDPYFCSDACVKKFFLSRLKKKNNAKGNEK